MRSPWLTAYAAVLTLAFGALVVVAARPGGGRATFDEIDVQRINVREPDGTLRMVLSDHARLPGIIVRGEERPFDRPQAGMLFYNDEASEAGGLIFGGRRNGKGEVVDAGGSLSFDRYGANQVVQLLGVHDRSDRFAGLVVSDSPPDSAGHRRIWVGRDGSGDATVELRDGLGRPRIVMRVAADGASSLTFLDADGRPVRSLAPE